MKKNKLHIVFSSHLSEEEDDVFIKHIENTIGCKEFEVHRFVNNNEFSLNELYNKALDEYSEDNSIIVFCHNDIIFRKKGWGKLILHKFNFNRNYDIIGVAGSTKLSESGRWWDEPQKMFGIVDHTDGGKTWTSKYSNKIKNIKPVVLIDGLFMAVNPSTIKSRFDEDFKGFHFYDLNFCINNFLDGCNIGVITDIRILHKSIGMTNSQWENNRQLFVEKFKEYLPLNIEEYEY